MLCKQISVFLENKTGNLSDVIAMLGDAGIDIQALSMADTTDFGVLRMIVSDADRAKALLSDAGITARTSEVLAIESDNRPGAFADQLRALSQSGIAVEYMYAFHAPAGNRATMVLRVDDMSRAKEVLGG